MTTQLPVFEVSYRNVKGEWVTRYFTGEMDDLTKWLDGKFLPFVQIRPCTEK